MTNNQSPNNNKIYNFFNKNKINYIRKDHKPIFTTLDSKKLKLNLNGTSTKNLFLRNKKGDRHFLLCISEEKKVNLKELEVILNSSKLSFASPERLKNILGILPGSVSLLSLINDEFKKVEVLIDLDIWNADYIQCHPLTNTSTISLKIKDLKKFLEKIGHLFNIFEVPLIKTNGD